MRYTRYDLKRNEGNKTFIVIMCLILVLAFLLGTVIFKILISSHIGVNTKTSSVNNSSNNNSGTIVSKTDNGNKVVKFVVIQGGVYKDKQNVNSEISILGQYGSPFVVLDGNMSRVLLGIYTEAEGEKTIQSLVDKKVDNAKITFTINNNDLCNEEISELINANIQILNKFSDKSVKSIQTNELKKWSAGLQKVDSSSKNITILKDIIDHVNNLPKEISKDKIGENYAYIYSVLKKVTSK
jgi:hypothetical protein